MDGKEQIAYIDTTEINNLCDREEGKKSLGKRLSAERARVHG